LQDKKALKQNTKRSQEYVQDTRAYSCFNLSIKWLSEKNSLCPQSVSGKAAIYSFQCPLLFSLEYDIIGFEIIFWKM
jgi:hypothetical protein